MSDRPTPPRLALRILEWRLPADLAEAVGGDLEDAYSRRVASGGSRLLADLWFWQQVLGLRARALRRAADRLGRAKARPVSTLDGRAFGASWLDVKIGLRMLKKHPALTLAAMFALAVGIPVGMAPMHVADALQRPLPEDRDGRIRAIRYWNVEASQAQRPGRFDVEQWRGGLDGFQSLGAARGLGYSVSFGDGDVTQMTGAEVTASVFAMLETPPLLGRVLNRADERTGAPGVVVIGYDLWRARFGATPDVIGTTLRMGNSSRTIVGVMPEGFVFPEDGLLYSLGQQLWVPLRDEVVSTPTRGPGYGYLVFGRLADGVGVDEAQAELATHRQRLAVDYPEEYEALRAEVVPFGIAWAGMPAGGTGAIPGFYSLQALCLVLLLVACANVGMLIFARTATRLRELSIRTALGASRARVVSQMFAESLVLSAFAAGVGLVGYRSLLSWLGAYTSNSDSLERMPYWFSLRLTPKAVLWALGLAVASAAFVSVAPALKVTGRRIQQSIQRAQAGRSGIRFGGVTGALIVADVAIAVAAVGLALGLMTRVNGAAGERDLVGIPSDEYLMTRVELDDDVAFAGSAGSDSTSLAVRVAGVHETLVDRLGAEPGVLGVAIASDLPRMSHNAWRIEVEGLPQTADLGFVDGLDRWVRIARVDLGFFEALNQPILAGRDFDQTDVDGDIASVIVNESFVERVLDGRNPIGRRIRPQVAGADPERWYEIVGVVPPLGMNLVMPEYDAGIYLPAAPGDLHPFVVGVHVAGGPEAFIPRLREVVNEVDADVVLTQPVLLASIYPGDWFLFVITSASLGVLVAILVAMAASGIYAIMSFAVSQRTREIGIRAALGAGKASIVYSIGRRALGQMGLGALLGIPFAAWLYQVAEAGSSNVGVSVGMAVLIGASVVTAIGVVSCVAPTKRVLDIQPTEALRGEA